MTVAIDIHFAGVFTMFDVRTLTHYIHLFMFTGDIIIFYFHWTHRMQ